MLTLQDILTSDSFAASIQKINQNFKQLAIAGGGPTGRRGWSGLPGLPGRTGSTGPSGPAGQQGITADVLPFGLATPSATTPGGNIVFSSTSLNWLQTNYPNPTPGMVIIDHNNLGFWQYEDGIAAAPGGNINPGDFDNQGYYVGPAYGGPGPDFNPQGTPGGEGWYFYPLNLTSFANQLQNVWVNDPTTYLTNPQSYGFNASNYATGPYVVNNARLKSKYGVVWITSHDDSNSNDPFNLDTPEIKDTQVANLATNGGPYGEKSSGVDRLVFKLSIDSLQFNENVRYRQLTDTTGPTYDPVSDQYFPGPSPDPEFYSPHYGYSLRTAAPLLFLAPNSKAEENSIGTPYTREPKSPLGVFAWYPSQDPTRAFTSWNFTTRVVTNPTDPENLNVSGPTPLVTQNYGELLFDVRRLLTSNQVTVLPPVDDDFVDQTYTGPLYILGESGPQVGQGFHVTHRGNTSDPDSMLTRAPHILPFFSSFIRAWTKDSWFGSSQFEQDPSQYVGAEDHINLLRSAGMKERFVYTDVGSTATSPATSAGIVDELVFYAAAASNPSGPFSYPSYAGNAMGSYPVVYMTANRTLGVGTFPTSNVGTFAPLANIHSHVYNLRPNTVTITNSIADANTNHNGKNYLSPRYVTRVAAFTSESRVDATTPEVGYTAITIGSLETPQYDLFNHAASSAYRPQAALLFQEWTNVTGPSGGTRTPSARKGSMQLGVSIGGPSSYDLTDSPDNYFNEFVLGVSPVYISTYENFDHSDRALNVAGVGVQNFYPAARFHMFGKNINETMFGLEPGINTASGPGASLPGHTPSHRQVASDYIEDYTQHAVGVYDYRYQSTLYSGAYNLINFPYNEGLLPFGDATAYENVPANTYNKYLTTAGPATGFQGWHNAPAKYNFWEATLPAGVGSATHGGQYNAWFDRNSYTGYNIFRDLRGHGDQVDATWVVGTKGNNNGGSALLSSADGAIAIVTIPHFRDGGRNRSSQEQRYLSTRTVGHHIRMVVSEHGDMGLGNRGGYDENAYPSLYKDPLLNTVYYLPTTTGPYNAYTSLPWSYHSYLFDPITFTGETYGKTSYAHGNTSAIYAARANYNATKGEYIRLEVGAEKAYDRPGRTVENRGWGYPANQTNTGFAINFLVKIAGSWVTKTGRIKTDVEGRITNFWADSGQLTNATTYTDIVLPHPSELVGGQSIDGVAGSIVSYTHANSSPRTNASTTWEVRDFGRANLRLNNFVAGEGEGETANPDTEQDTRTSIFARRARRSSPKIILTFEGTDKNTGTDVPRKVNTVILSSQNESTLREYYIPKSDNTGGTFMTFTSHFDKAPADDRIDRTSLDSRKFKIDELVYLHIQNLNRLNYPLADIDYNTNGQVIWDNILNSQYSINPFAHPYYARWRYSPNPLVGFSGTWGEKVANSTFAPYLASVTGPGHQLNSYPVGLWDPNGNNGDILSPAPAIPSPFATATAGAARQIWTSVENSWWGDSSKVSLPERSINAQGGFETANLFEVVHSFPSGVTDDENKPTQLRFKRINDTYSLFDFNITLKRNRIERKYRYGWPYGQNPSFFIYDYWGATTTTFSLAPVDISWEFMTSLNDEMVSNWVTGLQFLQYARFEFDINDLTFDPSIANAVPQFTENEYDNRANFQNWSGFRNWYSGTIMAGPQQLKGGENFDFAYQKDNGPRWIGIDGYKTWTGNFWNWSSRPGIHLNNTPPYGGDVQPFNVGTGTNPAWPGGSYPRSNANPTNTSLLSGNDQFNWFVVGPQPSLFQGAGANPTGRDYTYTANNVNGWISPSILWDVFMEGILVSYWNYVWDSSYLEEQLLLTMHNKTFSRHKNMMWRITPSQSDVNRGRISGDYQANGSRLELQANTFYLEIIAEDPILHSDIANISNLPTTPTLQDTADVLQWQCLTMNGQAITQFKDKAIAKQHSNPSPFITAPPSIDKIESLGNQKYRVYFSTNGGTFDYLALYTTNEDALDIIPDLSYPRDLVWTSNNGVPPIPVNIENLTQEYVEVDLSNPPIWAGGIRSLYMVARSGYGQLLYGNLTPF